MKKTPWWKRNRDEMGKFILIVPFLLAIPWAMKTFWQVRQARGPRERACIVRTSITGWMLFALAAVLLTMLKGQSLLFALPVFVVIGLGYQHASRKARIRVQLEESDPLSRARPLN